MADLPNFAKYVFLLHFIAAIILGLFWFLMPEYWNILTGWPDEVASGRIVGLATLTMAVGSIMAYRKITWVEVEIYVIMELVFNILGLIGMLWNMLTLTLPIVGWILIIILGFFSVLFLYIFFTVKE